jgi:hypothetical protein
VGEYSTRCRALSWPKSSGQHCCLAVALGDVFVLSFSALNAIWSFAEPQSTPELTLDFLRACSWKLIGSQTDVSQSLALPDRFLAPVLLVHRALRCSHYVGSETLVSLDSARSRRARVRKSSIVEHEAAVPFHAVKHIGMPSHAFQPGAESFSRLLLGGISSKYFSIASHMLQILIESLFALLLLLSH